MTKEDEHNNDNEEKIEITIESNDPVTGTQDEDESNTKLEDGGNLNLKEVKVENNVNPLFYEIGPLPRRTQKVWIQYVGPSPESYGGSALSYDSSRNDFVRLVLGLVLAMMICTAGFVFFCHNVSSVTSMFKNRSTGPYMALAASGILLGLSYAFACSGCTRMAPCSYVCLGFTVMCGGVLCAYITILVNTRTVFIALVATAAVVMVCLGLAFTSFDFTQCILFVIVAMVALCAASLFAYLYMLISGEQIKPLHIALLVIGTVLHSIMLVIELQMVLGGRSIELSEDDYAYGAFTIYLSIVNIFLNLLQLLSMDDLFG